MTRSLLALAAALAASSAAAQQPDCRNPTFQMEMTFCAEQGWLAADAELNAAYAKARAAMKALDALMPADQRGADIALRDAQRLWVPYRDAACAAEGYLMHGGSAEPMLIYGCRERLTRARTSDLRLLIEAQ